MAVRRFAVVAGAIALAVLGAAGCGSDGADAPRAGGTLIDAEDQAPPILNVLLPEGVTVAAQRVVSNIQQNLLTSDETGAFAPQLATAVPSGADVREGPLRVTFRLDPAARWSDGEPVTSADVVFTWRTMMDDRNEVASRSGWDRIRAITPGRDRLRRRLPGGDLPDGGLRGRLRPLEGRLQRLGGQLHPPGARARRAPTSTRSGTPGASWDRARTRSRASPRA